MPETAVTFLAAGCSYCKFALFIFQNSSIFIFIVFFYILFYCVVCFCFCFVCFFACFILFFNPSVCNKWISLVWDQSSVVLSDLIFCSCTSDSDHITSDELHPWSRLTAAVSSAIKPAHLWDTENSHFDEFPQKRSEKPLLSFNYQPFQSCFYLYVSTDKRQFQICVLNSQKEITAADDDMFRLSSSRFICWVKEKP